VKVIFWVEADLLDDEWNICDTIQWKESDFIILSAHWDHYKWDKNKITENYIKAIEKYHEKIKFIWHPYDTGHFWLFVNIEKLVSACNKYWVGLELNAKTINKWLFEENKLRYMLENANKICFNSDSHTLYELKETKNSALKYLKENGYI
jgi:histidinol phosphatase-like PHP family hydrolase